MKHKFEYENIGIVTRVIDGDTFVADIDLGYGIWKKKKIFRLYGIDTPESRGKNKCEEGIKVKGIVKNLIEGTEVIIRSIRNLKKKENDSFGRYLAIVLLRNGECDYTNLNEWLVQSNYATEYFGGKKK